MRLILGRPPDLTYAFRLAVLCALAAVVPVLPARAQDSKPADARAAAEEPIGPPAPAATPTPAASPRPAPKAVEDSMYLLGIGMLRLNHTTVEGNSFRYSSSDLGLPVDFSTRERASFTLDGTLGKGRYTIDGHLDYDPENNVTEPALDFLLVARSDRSQASIGDLRSGVLLDSVLSRYDHPFRGGVITYGRNGSGIDLIAGAARGEAGSDELPAIAGAGPYYLSAPPVLRGSETVFLVVKSATDLVTEVSRVPMVRNRDYSMDYDRGEILFVEPVFPTDILGNPVFVLVSYQFETFTGRFARDVFGMRARLAPWKDHLTLGAGYLFDADRSLPLDDAVEQRRGLVTTSFRLDTRRASGFGELSFGESPTDERSRGHFLGMQGALSSSFSAHVHSWRLDTAFPIFANEQLRYGYSLTQIFPDYAARNVYLSPFQFTRNLGTELYPFTASTVRVGSAETDGFLEWTRGATRLSAGAGRREEIESPSRTDIGYVSAFHDGSETKAWALAKVADDEDPERLRRDTTGTDALLGGRQRLYSGRRGSLFVQGDYAVGILEDRLANAPDTLTHSVSGLVELLTASGGVFAGYRKEMQSERDAADGSLADVDVFETGARQKVYRDFFVDVRFREQDGQRQNASVHDRIVSLGGGIESKTLRALARYETTVNGVGAGETKRDLWSLFASGTPVERLSLSLRYYRQTGGQSFGLSLDDRSEEQLGFRASWSLPRVVAVYSQWRYDRNAEQLFPLDRTRADSLTWINGVRVHLGPRWELIANDKNIDVDGPFESRRRFTAAEFAYLVQRHLKLGAGAERVLFEDPRASDQDYDTWVGYLKLVTVW
jgi:hypothetical protein